MVAKHGNRKKKVLEATEMNIIRWSMGISRRKKVKNKKYNQTTDKRFNNGWRKQGREETTVWYRYAKNRLK